MHEAAGHSASAVGNREMNAGTQVALFFFLFLSFHSVQNTWNDAA